LKAESGMVLLGFISSCVKKEFFAAGTGLQSLCGTTVLFALEAFATNVLTEANSAA
jgi:hypothetical protein